MDVDICGDRVLIADFKEPLELLFVVHLWLGCNSEFRDWTGASGCFC